MSGTIRKDSFEDIHSSQNSVLKQIEVINMLKKNPKFQCIVCNQPTLNQCSGCNSIYYCSSDHQAKHWWVHKSDCFTKQNHQKVNEALQGDYPISKAKPPKRLNSIQFHLDRAPLKRKSEKLSDNYIFMVRNYLLIFTSYFNYYYWYYEYF